MPDRSPYTSFIVRTALLLLSNTPDALAADAQAVLAINLIASQDEDCHLANGSLEVEATGGVPPYTYTWSNGTTGPLNTGLAAGNYTVTVVDGNLDQAQQTYTVGNDSWLPFSNGNFPAQDGHANCPGNCLGQYRIIESGFPGTPPYSYSEPVAGYDSFGHPFFFELGACGGDEVTLTVWDANGCTGDVTVAIVEPQLGAPAWAVSNLNGACGGLPNGSVTMTNVYNGGFFANPELELYDANWNLVNTRYNAGVNETFNNLLPGHYTAKRAWVSAGYQYTAYPCNGDTLGFDIPFLGMACDVLSGTVYLDGDLDCVKETGEPGLANTVLEILPGPHYAITGNNGSYSINLTNGAYTLDQTQPSLLAICPPVMPAPFTMSGTPITLDIADTLDPGLDLSVTALGSLARPGFQSVHYLQAKNQSPQVSGPLTLRYLPDPTLVFQNADLTPDQQLGDTLEWSFPPLNPFQTLNITVFLDVPVGTPIGQALTSTCWLSNPLPEITLSNNTFELEQTVTAGYDPNDKLVRTSTGWSDTQYVIGSDAWLEYTIRFQNTGTDTAFIVVITDTLGIDLDQATYEQGQASHPFEVEFLPGRMVQWTFPNILLPDSGTNEPASHGLVQFRIRPTQPELPGTVIMNAADIFFDFNPPVRTNDAVVTLETSTRVADGHHTSLGLAPNPAFDQVTLSAGGHAMEHVEILDMSGRTIRSNGFAPALSVVVPLDGMPDGIYLVRVMLSDGSVLHSCLVKG
ncbi:MAG: T9SS type A sorting domain-containing protein [Flavobacteriales bacterium]|nr:T9SS type A sorting domain-containing protein [Flavobacteriales bacterium]